MEIQLNSHPVPCHICKKESKYRCPRCHCRTCSLECCLQHKSESDCNGKRDRVAYVPLHEFTDSTLASDYYFLEDAIAKRERGKNLVRDMGLPVEARGSRVRKRDDGSDEIDPQHPLSRLKLDTIGSDTNHIEPTISTRMERREIGQYPKHKQKLVEKAKENGVNLLLMPPGMQRHMTNKSTKYDAKTGKYYWKVEFIFHCENKKKLILNLEKVPNDEDLKSRLQVLLESKLSHSAATDTRLTLRPFCVGTNQLKDSAITLMKQIPCKSSKPLFKKVDLGQNLLDLLRGTTVIEYPSFEIVLSSEIDKFPLLITEM